VGNEALAIALLCALTAETRTPAGIADGLWHAVLHSGDSDSTGSITGNLLGAMVGVKGLPPRWLSQVELRPVIERLGKDLYAVSVKKAHSTIWSIRQADAGLIGPERCRDTRTFA
jgi:ADP-ribosylglycohydrolase